MPHGRVRAQNQVIDRAPAVSSKVGVLLPISSAPRPAPRAVLVVHEDAADADRYRDALSSPELEVTTTTDVASAMRPSSRFKACIAERLASALASRREWPRAKAQDSAGRCAAGANALCPDVYPRGAERRHEKSAHARPYCSWPSDASRSIADLADFQAF